MTHNCIWTPTGVDTHRGEYWYKCEVCGKEEWFARYNLPKNKKKAGLTCPEVIKEPTEVTN